MELSILASSLALNPKFLSISSRPSIFSKPLSRLSVRPMAVFDGRYEPQRYEGYEKAYVFVDLENKHLNITRTRRPFAFFESEDTLVVVDDKVDAYYVRQNVEDCSKFEVLVSVNHEKRHLQIRTKSRDTVLQLPNVCKMDEVKAIVEKGVLSVVVPKYERSEQDVIVELDSDPFAFCNPILDRALGC